MARAVLAAYLRTCIDYRRVLVPGEVGELVLLAQSTDKAQRLFGLVRGTFNEVPFLKKLIAKESASGLALTSGVELTVTAASFRSVRGGTAIACIAEELAFWRSDDTGSRNPDIEIINAIKPAMLTTHGQLICISSPYARRGVLWSKYKKHFRADAPSRILVAQASSLRMNATLPQEEIDAEYAADPAYASAEYGALFRTDIESFISAEIVDAAVVPGRYELPPLSTNRYCAFVDPSGGSADSMTLAVCHADRDKRVVIDAVREVKPPFSPDGVVQEFAELLKSYGLRKVVGDRYAGEWPRERFRVHGIEYRLAEKPKSDLYRDMLPLLNSGRIELLDSMRLISQICGLERRTARGGRDSIDHAPNGHDDVANAVAGALVNCISTRGPVIISDEVLRLSAQPMPRSMNSGKMKCFF